MKHRDLMPRSALVCLVIGAAGTLAGLGGLGPTAAAAASIPPWHLDRAMAIPSNAVAQQGDQLVSSPRMRSDSLAARFTQLEARLPALEALLAQCRKHGIPTDYEMVNYTTIEHFIPWGREDLQDHTEDAAHIATALEQLYEEATTNLQAYLQRTKQAFAVPQYVTQQAMIDGYSFLGDMRWPDGQIEHHRPIFYTGYGFFGEIKKAIPYLTGYGTNIVQLDGIGPAGVIYQEGTVDWPISLGKQSTAQFRIDTTIAHSGTQSLRISNTSASGSVFLPLAVEARTTYRVTAWVKGHNVNQASLFTCDYACSRADDPGISVHPLPNGTHGWQQLEFTITTGDDILWSIGVRTAGLTDQLWIDDIQVSKVRGAVSLIPDSSFEAVPVHTATGYYASPTVIKTHLLPILSAAATHNIAVNLLLSPHYMPDWTYAKWPEIANSGQQFIGYNVLDPHVKDILDLYLHTLIPLIKSAPALHSLTLSNEPTYSTKGDTADHQAWHAHLQHSYSDIQLLNAAYGTHYAAFEDVPLHPTGLAGRYDWITFTNARFAGWHRWMADLIHQTAPTIPLHTKIQNWEDPGGGIDPGLFAEFSQISGNDSEDWTYYDLLGSLKVAPIFNPEDHLLQGDPPPSAAQVRNTLWQGAIHGRNASTIWVWERHAEDNLLQEPEVVAAVGKTNLDLNRLAKEVTALHAASTNVAILYSPLASSSTNAAKAWAALDVPRHGQVAAFVTDQQIAAGRLRQYKLVLIPAGMPVAQATLSALARFVDAGGRIITIGDGMRDSVLMWDDHAQPLPRAVRAHVLAQAVEGFSTANDEPENVALAQQLDALTRVHVLNATTNQPFVYKTRSASFAAGVEWQSVKYRDRWLVNVVADGPENQAVSLQVDGRKIERVKDLISGESFVGPVFHLRGLRPYLFELPASKTGMAPHKPASKPVGKPARGRADTGW